LKTAFDTVAKIIKGKAILNRTTDIDIISIDSRSLQNNATTLFFALTGKNSDAHQYINELEQKGVCNFVVSKLPENTQKSNFILVENTLKALQEFAESYRQNFHFPIIGITGSNGKTIVKEWLNFLLSPDYNIARSPKSYNSQIGVPLSVLGINENHNFGIFEAGISLPNEMQNLEKIIRPTIGILTNIGDAHDEGFIDKKQKISEKLKLFKHSDVVIFQKNELVEQLLQTYQANSFCWSFEKSDNALFIKKSTSKNVTTLTFTFHYQDFEVKIPFSDYASTENTINAMMVLLHLGYDKQTVENRMQMLYPMEMRLKVKNGINNSTIIDDSYISDFQSLKIALDFLEQQKQHKKKTIIFSDILQSGKDETELYREVSELFTQNKITKVIGIGKQISQHKDLFKNIDTYENTSEFLENFNSSEFANQTLLIKGARSFHLEEIVSVLEEKTHQTVLEINLNAITHNLNYFKSKLKPETKIMVMIKAFGYGSGSFEIAKLLEYHKVNYLGVAFVDEGIALRNAGITTPIIVMNPEPSGFSALISKDLEPEIYSLKELQAFQKEVEKQNRKKYPIHLKIDSGMHRLGFVEKDIPALLEHLKSNSDLFEVKSIFSHFSASDDLQFEDFTQEQFAVFNKLSNSIKEQLNIQPICHISNTSAISNYPEFQKDMVRLGIGLYGISNDESEMKYLENVGTLKSVILQIKDIQKGESVGYSRGFMAEKPIRTATIPIGYADGIPRAWGRGRGYVIINNKKAPILGSVCMDMLMVDITEISCNEGDAVVIFGENPNVVEMAKVLDTIPYEILTGISHRVKRVFYRE
jgi:alanine racemase